MALDGVATKRSKSARELLMEMGIEFEEGATAFYVTSSSELIVRATFEPLEAVDCLVKASNSARSCDKVLIE